MAATLATRLPGVTPLLNVVQAGSRFGDQVGSLNSALVCLSEMSGICASANNLKSNPACSRCRLVASERSSQKNNVVKCSSCNRCCLHCICCRHPGCCFSDSHLLKNESDLEANLLQTRRNYCFYCKRCHHHCICNVRCCKFDVYVRGCNASRCMRHFVLFLAASASLLFFGFMVMAILIELLDRPHIYTGGQVIQQASATNNAGHANNSTDGGTPKADAIQHDLMRFEDRRMIGYCGLIAGVSAIVFSALANCMNRRREFRKMDAKNYEIYLQTTATRDPLRQCNQGQDVGNASDTQQNDNQPSSSSVPLKSLPEQPMARPSYQQQPSWIIVLDG